jgi:preprotein translocase subunit SecD
MLNLPRWQVIGIIAVTLLAALFALPNLLPGSVLVKLPGWYQQSRINLGLDLRGGAHFLLEADLRSVLNERLTNLSDSVRGELRKQQVGFKDVTVQSGASVPWCCARRRSEPRRSRASAAIDPSLQVSGAGDTIQLAFSNVDLVRKKKEVIDQSIEILRRRVDETGTIEPTIVRQGDDRILLQVPGIKDTTDLKRKINQTAKLTFHLVNEDVAQTGQNIPANLPPTTFLAPTREGMQALRAANPKAFEEILSANPRLTPDRCAGATSRLACRCLSAWWWRWRGSRRREGDLRSAAGQPADHLLYLQLRRRPRVLRRHARQHRQAAGDPARQRDHQRAVVQSAICRRQRYHHRPVHHPADPGAGVAAAAPARCPLRCRSSRSGRWAPTWAPTPIRAGTVAAVVGTALVILFMLFRYGPSSAASRRSR